jgi:hypothetical protein
MGCKSSRAIQVANPIQAKPNLAKEKTIEKATLESSYYEATQNHTNEVELCSDLFQFLPSLVPYKVDL